MNSSGRLEHQPALDGLRGLAVVAVVTFHAGAPWAGGGFLGVSTFFTLSGFLIGSLLLAEQRSTGRVDLRAFWARRARRLLPASMLTLFAVAALAPTLASAEQLDGLRADIVAALGYMANWRFLVSGHSYGELFAAPSPVLHFWSLAIEEQLYVFLPLLLLVVPRRRLAPVLGALVCASVGLGWVLSTPGGSTSAAYYGTGVRAGELLVGALLALLVADGRVRARSLGARTAGVVGLVGLLVAWSVLRQDDTVLYRGGLVVHALVSALVITACLVPGPVRSVLSVAPLRALGRISYGVYLYHWPVFVWLDAPVLTQLVVTLGLSVASYHLVEQPIRQRRVVVRRRSLVALPVAMSLVLGVAVASTLDPPRPESFSIVATKDVIPPPDAVEPELTAPRVALFGDSTALRTGFGLRGWSWQTGRIEVLDGGVRVGCPLGRGGLVDWVVGDAEPDEQCVNWPNRWGMVVAEERLDAAVVQIGPWDVTDRKLPGDDSWTHIGQPAYDAFLERELHLAVDVLSRAGATVIWLASPHIDYGRSQPNIPKDQPISDPARMDRLNELIRKVDASRDEMVVLDLVGHLASMPGGELDWSLRPDGAHFTEDAAADLAPWLAESIIDLVQGRGSPTADPASVR